MTPKQKAKELIAKYKPFIGRGSKAVRETQAEACALIAIDELIRNTETADSQHIDFYFNTGYTGFKQYWQQVKEEIENL